MFTPDDAKEKIIEPIKIKVDDLSRSSSPNVGPYPVSVRLQTALIKQMEQPSPGGSTDSERPNTPGSSKRIKISKVHRRNERGETPLTIAAKNGRLEQCQELIELGAEVNCRDNAGWTPLHEACAKNKFEIAQLLIKHGANVNKVSDDGETPLHDAVDSSDIRIVWLLLKNNADRTIRNREGKQPIDWVKDQAIADLLRSETMPEECPLPLSRPSDSSNQSSQSSVALIADSNSTIKEPIIEPVSIIGIMSSATIDAEYEPSMMPPQSLAEHQQPLIELPPAKPAVMTAPPPPQPVLPVISELPPPKVAEESIVQPPPPEANFNNVNELELSEESSATSSRASPFVQAQSSPSASPVHGEDVYLPPQEDPDQFDNPSDVYAEKKKKPAVRKAGTRPTSGSSTPVGKKTKGGKNAKRTSKSGKIAEAVEAALTEDPYAFRGTPESEMEGTSREASVGPTVKKSRYEEEEPSKDDTFPEDEPYDDEESSRSVSNIQTKKVPILRISLAATKQASEDDDISSQHNYKINKPLGTRQKGGRKNDGEEQRVTRSKFRQTGRGLGGGGEDSEHWAKKKRHLRASDVILEETTEEYIGQKYERQVTPNPETLTEGQKLLYMPPHKGVYNLKKKLEACWAEDCKKDKANQSDSSHRFKNLLLMGDMFRNDMEYYGLRKDQIVLPVPEMLKDPVSINLYTKQELARRELQMRQRCDALRLQLVYEQEYVRMIRRRDGTAPKMSAVRMFRESELLNPLILDETPHTPPQIDEAAFFKKVEEGCMKLYKEHKMDADAMQQMQVFEWRSLARKKHYSWIEDSYSRLTQNIQPSLLKVAFQK